MVGRKLQSEDVKKELVFLRTPSQGAHPLGPGRKKKPFFFSGPATFLVECFAIRDSPCSVSVLLIFEKLDLVGAGWPTAPNLGHGVG